jgi:hypothetical protein
MNEFFVSIAKNHLASPASGSVLLSGYQFWQPHFLRVAAAFFAEREREAAERLAAAVRA